MSSLEPDCDCSPADRRREIVRLLALGLTRLRRGNERERPTPLEQRFFSERGLEVPGQNRLSVPTS